ncbi:hypothetical protein MANY_39560 [Mycolicibacterium anyangense]|uniref:3,4-dihydroxy-2-butanone-4-phosphate synthase n=1 Tax=Mycolicibacterium anyangense TaxID=1431246 RepID=A0A6N4WC71_9MYCO|nr:3,4-dihydroxy-2-butanone-4-phosphate synthase [Mycolicibacterium anyangense]BBZ78619.1 hypothetical protein MANY_39560 [Mycolicibacterium anyangense]
MTIDDAVVKTAADSISRGECIVLFDDFAEDGGADLVMAAALVTTAQMAFFVRYTGGFIAVALPESRCNRLRIPSVVDNDEDWRTPHHGVAVDAAEGIGTGISATDRAHTARLLADPESAHADFTRPGHVIPLRVPRRAYRSGAADPIATALYLCAAGGFPAALRSQLVQDAGPRMTGAEAEVFARAHGLLSVSHVAVLRAVNPATVL